MRRGILCSTLLLAALAQPVIGCRGVSEREAKALVARYNAVVSEAYRRADIALIDSVVAPRSIDGKRLLGLIGVRKDMGITLDAHLTALTVTKLEQEGDTLHVWTKERWRYRDIRVGSGEQVGQASRDSYAMHYLFERRGRRWLVMRTRFTVPPKVGRKAQAWGATPLKMHGITTPRRRLRGKPHKKATARPASRPASRPAAKAITK